MPLYSFKCQKCGDETEQIVNFSDDLSKLKCEVEKKKRSFLMFGANAGASSPHKCKGQLVRSEEVETAGTMKYAWKP